MSCANTPTPTPSIDESQKYGGELEFRSQNLPYMRSGLLSGYAFVHGWGYGISEWKSKTDKDASSRCMGGCFPDRAQVARNEEQSS